LTRGGTSEEPVRPQERTYAVCRASNAAQLRPALAAMWAA
jgi:hypothetical protein